MYNTFLALTDGSELSSHAVEHAAISAEKWGAKLKIMTVVPPTPVLYTNTGGFSRDYSIDYKKAIMSYHLSVLENSKELVKEKYPGVKVSTYVKKGNVVQKILEASDEKEVNMIFIGGGGLSGLDGCFLGGVSNQIVNRCTKPVLVFK